jgi:RimJ/RimL family protein N-acetyltransferase
VIAGQDGRVRAPDLHVDELRIRFWQPDDAEALFRACQDEVLHYFEPGLPDPYRIQDAVAFITEVAPRVLEAGTNLHLAVLQGGDLVGGLALNTINRRDQSASIGYWTAPWARGRRVSERAARELLRWAFADGFDRVDWTARIGNHASRLTALRLGFEILARRPGTPAKWVGAVTPKTLTTKDLPPHVRMTARAFASPPPELAAGPVTLRQMTEADIPSVTMVRNDPEVARWFGIRLPYPEELAREHVLVNVPNRWKSAEEATFAISAGSVTYAGAVDLRVIGTDPAAGEVGYYVAPAARGRGYATAAVRAISRWGFEQLGLSRIQIRWQDGNEGSRRVAEKAGFRTEGLLRQALVINGVRRDCWVASLLEGEVA